VNNNTSNEQSVIRRLTNWLVSFIYSGTNLSCLFVEKYISLSFFSSF
jgi:hypothetical protein